ncbi:MAG: peptidoglycan editing factor PgeF [Anaerolineae bacterium]|nr:peptidoglycan editing factor PgeF [Anaerolineae bacterium]MDW8071088.1 peptidoglycan editing factor PgeF [Anaerolineae bacterium]
MTQLDGLPVYQFEAWLDQPHLVHAIFTRHGGVSRPPYATLNLSRAVGDDPSAVEQNHARIYQALHISRSQVVQCHLMHGTAIRVVTGRGDGGLPAAADGLVTAQPGVMLSMRFADCVPILLHDPQRRAVGLVHAGWRGTLQSVAAAAVRVMTEQLGCAARDITAVIGPSIGPCCYEVGGEVIQALAAALPDMAAALLRREGQRVYLDLWQANCQQLLAAGVGCVQQMAVCTACRRDLFFSHRGDGGRTGRFGVVIGYRVVASP